jgi:murein DD-endopeptidase MepM/ murein hydrolase activator NlpD
MFMAKGQFKPAAACRRISQSNHQGGGAMKRNNVILVLTTLFVLVASCFSPLMKVESAKAQSQFSNCVDGKCTFPLARSWGGGDCEFNIQHTLDTIGQGQNYWLIPTGNEPQSFISKAGSMDTSSGYKDITLYNKVTGKYETVPGRCACDVASMFYITGVVNGLNGQPTTVNHYAFPGVVDIAYSVMIYNYGQGNKSNSDLLESNPFDKDAIYRWKVENGNIVMWVEVGGMVPDVTPQATETQTVPDGLAQDNKSWACQGGNSPCGFPLEGGRDKFVVREAGEPGHDSCDPEGSCPWLWGHDFAWADEATAAERPTKVLSVINGKVTQACAIDTFQNKVIKVENADWTQYDLHVDSCFVTVGQEVKIGDALGIMGNTGNFGQPGLYTHLHFALKRNNEERALEDISPLWTSDGSTQPVQNPTAPEIEKVDNSAISEGTRQLYRSIFNQNKILKALLDTKVMDEDQLITLAVWLVRALAAFVLLFIVLILKLWGKDHPSSGHWEERKTSNPKVSYWVYIPRDYLNGWYWIAVVVFRILIWFCQDPLFRRSAGETWWILLGLAIFFSFAKKADKEQNRNPKKTPSKTRKMIWDWTAGTGVLIVAAYIWGGVLVLIAYAFSGMMSVGRDLTTLGPIGPLPEPSLDWITPTQNIPYPFVQRITPYMDEIVAIAREEDVPPEVIFALVLKEGGQLLTNPANGEGFCGFYDLVASGQAYFTPGPVSHAEALREFRLCAKEFKKRSSGYDIHFDTTDLSLLGPVYMRYNGNIDCHGNAFASFKDHPYVMNGWDKAHTAMVARDGQGGCVALKVIGAIPAHVRIGQLLRTMNKTGLPITPETPAANYTGYGPPVWPYRVYPGSYVFGSYSKFDYQNKHTGIDIWAPAGTAVYSSCTGTVVWWGDWPWSGTGSWQNTVWVNCHDGNYYGYTHMDDLETHANVGDEVVVGQQIAVTMPLSRLRVGDDAHLHWMRTKVDPTKITSSNLRWIFEDPITSNINLLRVPGQ